MDIYGFIYTIQTYLGFIYIYTIQTREDESAEDERCDQHNEDLTHQRTGMSPVKN